MAEHQSANQDRQKPFNPPGVEKQHNHDLTLMKEVKDALLTQTESAGIDVKVAVEDGWVRLHGVVDALSHKTAAEEIARKVPGVRRIENDITVANEETFSDKDLLAEVTDRITKIPEYRNIGVRVHKGVVSLVGHAGSHGDVQEAARIAEGCPGVKEVKVQRVKVGEGEKEDDADVSRAAERLLDQMGYNHQHFEVYCDAGVLFVKGLVPTREDKSRIKTEMHKIPGVDKLEALLIPEDQMLHDDEVH
ncbi:MAG: BON domain-containing protein [Bacillota bacterium]